MCGHVIWAFIRMDEIGRVFPYQLIKMAFEVFSYGRVGVFIDAEACGSVLDKYLTYYCFDLSFFYFFFYV